MTEETGTAPAAPRGEDPIIAVATAHPALVITALVAVVALIEVTRAADGRVPTMLAILEAQGPAAIVTGTTATLLPFSTVVVVQYLWLAVGAIKREGRRSNVTETVAFLLTLIALFVAPLTILLFVAFLQWVVRPLVSWVLGFFNRELRPSENDLRSVMTTGLLLLLGNLLWISTWLPKEEVKTDFATISGFVLSQNSDWTSVLVDDGKYVLRLASGSIVARTVCGYEESWATYSLTDFLKDTSHRYAPVPDCPTPP